MPDSRVLESLDDHVVAFEASLRNRELTVDRVKELAAKIRRMISECGFRHQKEINEAKLEEVLANWRTDGMSRQTSNHYLKAMKQFCRWAVKTGRATTNPVDDIKTLNVKTDRRHDRRPLSQEELTRLVHAAEGGKPVESVSGADRAMMYVLSAWTGYRKGEIGSITKSSFNLKNSPPTVTVRASYSKRRNEDSVVLHESVVARLTNWLSTKKFDSDTLLFPVSGKIEGGVERKTAKMMRVDLAAARKLWLSEAESDEDRKLRGESDFLLYKGHCGKFADFHANRHTFITNLALAGVSPKTAQMLARHSDIRLTMNTYTHSDQAEQMAAVKRLPALQQYTGSAPVSQSGSRRQKTTVEGNDGKSEPEPEGSTQTPVASGDSVESQPLSANGESTPGRIRTSNPRFRRPVLYPVELRMRGRDCSDLFLGFHSGSWSSGIWGRGGLVSVICCGTIR